MTNLTQASAPSEWLQGYLASEETARDVISVKRVYIDICGGNLYDGLMLSQVIFWHGKNRETGQPRLRIFRDGHYWLAKTYEDWWDECRVKERVARECVARLEKTGLIVTKVFKFKGAPTKHIRMDWNAFESAIRHLMSDGNDSKCQMEMTSDGRSYTETTVIDHKHRSQNTEKLLAVAERGGDFDSDSAKKGGVVTGTPGQTPRSGGQKEKSSVKKEKGAPPRQKWNPDEHDLDTDNHGWLKLPSTPSVISGRREKVSRAKANAIRDTQLWLIDQGIRKIELSEDDDGVQWVEHLGEEEPLEDALDANGSLPLRLLRDLAYDQGLITQAEFNETLENFFWENL